MPLFEVNNDRLGLLHGLTQDSAPPLRSQKPLSRPSSKRKSSRPTKDTAAETTSDDPSRPRSSKFRFKRKRSKDSHRHHHSSSRSEDSHRRHHSPRSSGSSKRRRSSHHHKPLNDDPAEYDDTYLPNTSSFKYSTTHDAFRESLFDAMADDEGAAFWEGVYGQPIHTYPRPDRGGKLEQMTDEEYAEYVRSKMWEKTHQHLVEEREKRERDREAKKEEQKKREEEERIKERKKQARESQARGEEGSKSREKRPKHQPRDKRKTEKQWNDYLLKWKNILSETKIPWPVESGRLEDVEKGPVEQFFLDAQGFLGDKEDIMDVLKAERIKWHPDKAQQRWGKKGLSEKEVKGITAVFQIVDSMWAERRSKREGRA